MSGDQWGRPIHDGLVLARGPGQNGLYTDIKLFGCDQVEDWRYCIFTTAQFADYICLSYQSDGGTQCAENGMLSCNG